MLDKKWGLLIFLILLPSFSLATTCVDSSTNTNSSGLLHCVHGKCVNNKCKCFNYYTGEDCGVLYTYKMGDRYLAYMYTMCVLWLLLSVYLFRELIIFFKLSRSWNMKHLSLILLFIGSFLRVPSYWITIDGNFDRNVALDPFGAFTYYFYYPCVISAYTCEIFIWSELLISNVVYAPIQRLPKLRNVFLVVNILVFVVELSVRILSYVYRETLIPSMLFVAWVIYVGSVALLETIGSLTIAVKVLRAIKALEVHNRDKVRKRVKNMTMFVVLNTIVLIAAIVFSGLAAAFSTGTTAWYALNWLTRPLEIIGVLMICMAIRPPKGFKFSSSRTSAKDMMAEKQGEETVGRNAAESTSNIVLDANDVSLSIVNYLESEINPT